MCAWPMQLIIKLSEIACWDSIPKSTVLFTATFPPRCIEAVNNLPTFARESTTDKWWLRLFGVIYDSVESRWYETWGIQDVELPDLLVPGRDACKMSEICHREGERVELWWCENSTVPGIKLMKVDWSENIPVSFLKLKKRDSSFVI